MRLLGRLGETFLFSCLVLVCDGTQVMPQDLDLPTSRDALHSFDPAAEEAQLFADLMAELTADQQGALMQMVLRIQMGQMSVETREEARLLLSQVDWDKHRDRVLRLAIYRSGVLDIFSSFEVNWKILVHDFLLLFLDRLSEERLAERLLSIYQLSQDTEKGRGVLALIDRTPSLQKIGQILARYPDVPPGMRYALQHLENSIQTSDRDEIVDFITADMGPERIAAYNVEFDESLLAEATVGAVIKSTLCPDDKMPCRQAVCKVIKPYALAALEEELVILTDLVDYFEKWGPSYELGEIPLAEMFKEAKDALSREVMIREEQGHLREAWEYYKDDPRVKVPELFAPSTENVTFMEFIEGFKIVDAYRDNPELRSKLAVRLDRIMTYEVLFSGQEEAIFHGDPHAGNVFYVPDEKDPYRIGLLDWGLRGKLRKEDRKQLIQLLLGVRLNHEKRIRNNVGVLVHGGWPEDEKKREEIRRIAVESLGRASRRDGFQVLSDILWSLTRAGYRLDFDLALFIKAQITITGLLHDLDPSFKQGRNTLDQVEGQVTREMPKRLLNTIYFPRWNSHDYPSMLSNEDIKDVQIQSLGRSLKKLGKLFRRALCGGSGEIVDDGGGLAGALGD